MPINPTQAATTFYYPLPQRQPRVNSVNRANNADAAAPAFAVDVLVDTGRPNTSALFDVTDLVDLSPQAQDFIDFFNGASSALTSDALLENGTIILTDVQRAQIDAVILRFKDAPFTPATFHEIVEELADEGLSPEQITAQQQTTALSLSERFLRLLTNEEENAPATDVLSFNNQQDRDNRDAYLRVIFGEWERISNQFHPTVIANFIQPPTPLRRNV